MFRSLPASLLLHTAIIGVGYISWPYLSPPSDAGERLTVPIEFVEITDVTNIVDVPEPPETEPDPFAEPELPDFEELLENVDAPPEPLPEPEAEAEPPADTTVIPDDAPEEETPEPEAEPEPEPEPEVEPDPEPEPEPDLIERERERRADTLAGLLEQSTTLRDKAREEAEAAQEAAAEAEAEPEAEPEPPRRPPPRPEPEPELEDAAPPPPRRGAGDRTANTASLEAAVRQQMSRHWETVDDQPRPETLSVRMKLILNPDGSIDDLDVISPTRLQQATNRSLNIAADRALRAARRAAPFRLPADSYSEWREITVIVEKSSM